MSAGPALRDPRKGQAGFASPEELFEYLRVGGESDFSIFAPDERATVALTQLVFGRFVIALAGDKAGTAEQEYERIVTRYKLKQAIEAGETADGALSSHEELKAFSKKTLNGADVDALGSELLAFREKYTSHESPGPGGISLESGFYARGSKLKGIKTDDQKATATFVGRDGTEKSYGFVEFNGRWYFSFFATEALQEHNQ